MTRGSFALGAVLTAIVAPVPGHPARPKSPETYIFIVSRVDLAKDVPKEVEAQVVARLGAAIAEHDDLDSVFPKTAPDPDVQPQKFKDYLKARRQRAFKVNVEVSQYSVELESAGATRTGRGQYLTVRVTLQLFGETIPDRVMAFSGEGTATVKLEVGKTVRPRDREEANSAALDEAVAGAIASSLVKLREPPPSQQKKKPGKP